MEIMSSGICKKPSLDVSEDITGMSNGFSWLLDGATPPFGDNNHEKTVEYVCNLSSALSKLAVSGNNTRQLLFDAISHVKNKYNSLGCVEGGYVPYSTAIVIKSELDSIEYTVLGDSFLGICINENTVIVTDDRLKKFARVERNIVRNMRKIGIDENSLEYLEARKRLIYTELSFQNKENGYWVSCLDPQAAYRGLHKKITISKNDRIMIFAASDGLARLTTHFGHYRNICNIGNDIIKYGDCFVFKKLRSLESEKSNFIKPASSGHDDASYVLLSNSNYIRCISD